MDVQLEKQKKIAFFAPGVLAFEKSGHTLTRDKAYYVCSKKQKGQCDLPEKRIKTEYLERNFSRLAKKFELPENEKSYFIRKHVLGKILHDMLDEAMDVADSDFLDATIEVAKQDIKTGQTKQARIDIRDAKETLQKETDRNPDMVGGLLFGTVMVFGKGKTSENDMGRTLAYFSKKIYLSDEGEIKKIKLHQTGDFIFQFIKKYIPSYQEPAGLLIERENFESLDYKDFAKKIRRGEIKNPIPPLAPWYGFMDIARLIFSNITTMTPEKALDEIMILQNSPIGQMAMNFNRLTKKNKKN
jgi:hypothetical protein